MKTSKILPGIGIIVLTITGIVSTKAHKKSTPIIAASFIGVLGLNGAFVTGLSGTHFTDMKGPRAVTVYLRTAVSNTKIGTLVTILATPKKVYYH